MHGALSLQGPSRWRIRVAVPEGVAGRSTSHGRPPKPHRTVAVCASGALDGQLSGEQPALADAALLGSTAGAPTATTTPASDSRYDPEYLKRKARRHRKYEEEYATLPPEERTRRLRILRSNTGNTPWNKGRKHSPETIEKIREQTKQALLRPEVAAKVAKVNFERIGTKLPRNTRAKISEGGKAVKAEMTEEQKQELRRACSERTKAMWQDPEYRAKVMASLEKRRAMTAVTRVSKEETPEQREARLARRREQRRAHAARLAQQREELSPEEREQKRLQALEKARERGRAVWADPATAEERRAKISAAIRAKWADPEYRERTLAGISRAHEPSHADAGAEGTRRRSRGGASPPGQVAPAWSVEELAAMEKVMETHPLVTFTWAERLAAFKALVPESMRTQGGLSRKYNALVATGRLSPAPRQPPSTRPAPRRTASPARTSASGGKARARAKEQAAIDASKEALQELLARVGELQRMVRLLEDKMVQLRARADDFANDPAAYSDCLQNMQESEALLLTARAALDRQMALVPPYVQYNDKGIITEILVPANPNQPLQQAPQQPRHAAQAPADHNPGPAATSLPTSTPPQHPSMPPPTPPSTPGAPSTNGVHSANPGAPYYYSPHQPSWQRTPPYPHYTWVPSPQQHPYPPPPASPNNGTYMPPPGAAHPAHASSASPPATPGPQPPPATTPPSTPPEQQWPPPAMAPPYAAPANGWAGHQQVNGYANGTHHPHEAYVVSGLARVEWRGADSALSDEAGRPVAAGAAIDEQQQWRRLGRQQQQQQQQPEDSSPQQQQQRQQQPKQPPPQQQQQPEGSSPQQQQQQQQPPSDEELQ